MDAEGSNQRRLTFDGDYNDGASWSPEGDLVVYSSRRGGRFQIAVTNVVTLATRVLTSGPGDNEAPTFSPDARKIAFVSRRSGRKQIYVIDLDGGNSASHPRGNNDMPECRAPRRAIAIKEGGGGKTAKRVCRFPCRLLHWPLQQTCCPPSNQAVSRARRDMTASDGMDRCPRPVDRSDGLPEEEAPPISRRTWTSTPGPAGAAGHHPGRRAGGRPPPAVETRPRIPPVAVPAGRQRRAAAARLQPDVYFGTTRPRCPMTRAQAGAQRRPAQDQGQFIVTIEGPADERGRTSTTWRSATGLQRGARRPGLARRRGDRLRTISYGDERPVCTELD